MSSVSSLWPRGQRLQLTLRNQLDSIEMKVNAATMESTVQSNLAELGRLVQEMKMRLSTERRGNEVWVGKVNSLAEDYEGLSLHFERIKEHKMHTMQTRDQLFGDRNTIRERRQNAEYQQREGESLTHSINMLDQQIDTGMEVLNSLDRQGRVLQDSTGKLKDADSLVGLANSVVRMIGRKTRSNAMLTYFCMVFTVLIVGLTYYYVRYLPSLVVDEIYDDRSNE